MKKYLFFAAAVAITACTQDTLIDDTKVPEATKEVAIGFGTGMNNMTRAGAENSGMESKWNLEAYHQNFLVWGYKNVATSTADVYTSTPVFNKVTLTWNDSPAAPFDQTNGDWVYETLRYWDKAATSYDFHAAAPADATFAWTQVDATDGKGNGYFTYNDATVSGESLAMDKEVTGQPTSASDQYYDKFTTDKDLMIATDEVNQKPSTFIGSTPVARVNFNFNHILSRLNIGVKKGDAIQTTYAQIPEKFSAGDPAVEYTVYTSDKNTDKYGFADSEYYKLSGTSGSYTVGEKYTPASDETMTAYMVDDTTSPTKGVVKLKNIAIVNIVKKGSFNENLSTAGITATELADGTTKRWDLGTTPEKTASDAAFGYTGELNLSADQPLTNGETAEVGDFKYVYQGLTIPQVVKYEPIKLDGSDIASAAEAYIKIVYTLDDEEYSAYYNLADAFKVSLQKKNAAGDLGYLTVGGQVVYTDGTNWVDEDGNAYVPSTATDPLATDSDNNNVPAYTDGNERDGISFCEGWQNNLKITINPTAILFDASVYAWKNRYTEEITVE